MEALPKIISNRWLASHQACPDQRKIFKEEWPLGGKVTEESLLRASALGLNLHWFIAHVAPDLLDQHFLVSVSQLNSVYHEKRKPMCDAYILACKPLDRAHTATLLALDARYEAKGMRVKTPQDLHALLGDPSYRAEYNTLHMAYHAELAVLRERCFKQDASLYAEYRNGINALVIAILLKEYAKQSQASSLDVQDK